MIRLPVQRIQRLHRWRISNPLAAFAAIMLFASTQISGRDDARVASSGDSIATASNVGALHIAAARSELDGALDGLQPEDCETSPQASHTGGGSGKSRSANLNLFLLRR